MDFLPSTGFPTKSLGQTYEKSAFPPRGPYNVRTGRQIAGRYPPAFREVTHRLCIVVSRSDRLRASYRLVTYVSYWDYGYIMTVMCVFQIDLALDC